MGLQAGERLTVADLLRGLLLASANDAAATLAQGVAGSRARFVREMNARARGLGLAHTRFADPVGLEARSQSSARDLVTPHPPAPALLVLPADGRPGRRDPAHGRPGADARQPQHARAAVPVGQRRQDGPHEPGGLRPRGLRDAQRRHAGLRRARHGERGGAQRRHPRAPALRASAATRARRAVRRGRVLATAPIRFRRGAELRLVAGRTVRRVVERGTRLRTRVVSAPSEVRGPDPQGAADRGAPRCSRAAGPWPPSRSWRRPRCRRRAWRSARKDWVTRPLAFALAVLAVGGSVGLLLRRRSRTRPPRPRRAGGSNSEVEAA